MGTGTDLRPAAGNAVVRYSRGVAATNQALLQTVPRFWFFGVHGFSARRPLLSWVIW